MKREKFPDENNDNKLLKKFNHSSQLMVILKKIMPEARRRQEKS